MANRITSVNPSLSRGLISSRPLSFLFPPPSRAASEVSTGGAASRETNSCRFDDLTEARSNREPHIFVCSRPRLFLHTSRDPRPATSLCWRQSLPFQQLQVLFALSSESFASFPHGTCSLSVSHRVFSLGWGIPPAFRLHSQATRLCDCLPLLVAQCSLPFYETVPTGISPSVSPTFPGDLGPLSLHRTLGVS